MPVDGKYTDSASVFNREHDENWQSLGSLVARLKARCEAAIIAGNGEVAESYHARLIEAEFAERGRGE